MSLVLESAKTTHESCKTSQKDVSVIVISSSPVRCQLTANTLKHDGVLNTSHSIGPS